MAPKSAKQIETMEHVPASEHGGGFPPFQKDTFASQLLWITLAFVGLYLLMSRVALPRIGSIIEDRKQRIASDFAEAERLKAGSDALPWPTRNRWPMPCPGQALANRPRTRGQGRRERPQVLDASSIPRSARPKTIATRRSAAMKRPGHCGRGPRPSSAPDRLGPQAAGRGRRRRRAQALRTRC
jgi:F-type H+-transporting ATPase subunit b